MNRKQQGLSLWALAVVILLAVGVSAVLYLKQGAPRKTVTAAKTLPDASFRDKDGKVVSVSDFKGKVVLVNLWATWCPPCVAELPALDMLHARLRDKGFAVIAVSLDRGDMKVVTDFLDKRGVEHLAAYQDADRDISRKWEYGGIPASFLVARDGTLLERIDGPREWVSDEVLTKIERVVAP